MAGNICILLGAVAIILVWVKGGLPGDLWDDYSRFFGVDILRRSFATVAIALVAVASFAADNAPHHGWGFGWAMLGIPYLLAWAPAVIFDGAVCAVVAWRGKSRASVNRRRAIFDGTTLGAVVLLFVLSALVVRVRTGDEGPSMTYDEFVAQHEDTPDVGAVGEGANSASPAAPFPSVSAQPEAAPTPKE